MTRIPILTGLTIAVVVGWIVVGSMGGPMLDAQCEHTLGENVTALEGQQQWNQQLDCQYPNGTVVYDVEPKPMNVTS